MFKVIPLEAIIIYSREIFPIFKDKILKEEIEEKLRSIGEANANNFYRASLIYIQSQKCLTCDTEHTTSVGTTLLCTAIETVCDRSKQYEFHVWLRKCKLKDLEHKSEKELDKILTKVYDEYLESPLRTGLRYDFTNFLIKYCPDELKVPPISIEKNDCGGKYLSPITFDKAANLIYGEYRSGFVHDSLMQIDLAKQFSDMKGTYLLKYIKKIGYHTNLNEFPIWFSRVVKESLYNFLISEPITDGQ